MTSEYEYQPLSPEEQFDRPIEVTLPGQGPVGPDGLPEDIADVDTMTIYDVAPEEPVSDIPVVMIPGWTGTIAGLRQNMLTMAALGRRTLGVGAPHGIGATETVPGYPLAEARKMQALLTAMDIKEVDRVDAVSHSEGAIVLTMAATLHPARFRNMVLVSPAGLMGQDSWVRLLSGFTRDVYEQLIEGVRDRTLLNKVKDLFSQISRALRGRTNRQLTMAEVQAIIDSHIEKLLVGLKRQGHGLAIIHDVDDREFPMARIQQVVTAGMVHGFLSVRGRHQEMFLQPANYTKAIAEVLTALECRRT